MSSVLGFTPVYGVDSPEGPLCSLLSVDGCNVLLDCGWDYRFELATIEPLRNISPNVDLVLLSHPDIVHLGALPYAFKNFGLKAPVFCIHAIFHFGKLALRDAVLSLAEKRKFTQFTISDVEECFNHCIEYKNLNYYSPITFSPQQNSGEQLCTVTLTPHRAGHLVGGTIWKIARNFDDVVYATDFNNFRERHLEAGDVNTIPQELLKPSLLITDSVNALQRHSKRNERDLELLTILKDTLCGKNGNVLIPSDSSGRALELALLLDFFWETQPMLQRFPLFILSTVSTDTCEAAKVFLEFMSNKLRSALEDKKNPFDFKYVKLVKSLQPIWANSHIPICVVASDPTLESGFSRDLFVQWAEADANTVILVDRTVPGTVGSNLYQYAFDTSRPHRVEIPSFQLVPLGETERAKIRRAEESAQRIRERAERAEREREEKAERERAEKEKAEEENKKMRLKAQFFDLDEDVLMSDEIGLENSKLAQSVGFSKRRALNEGIVFENTFDATSEDFQKIGLKYPMFPFKERLYTYDICGADVDLSRYSEKVETSAEHTHIEKPKAKLPEVNMHLYEKEFPSIIPIDLHCRVCYVDLEGRCDGIAMKRILSDIKARKVVVIRGCEDARNIIKDWMPSSDVYIPLPGDKYEFLSEKKNIYARLSSDLRDKLFTKVSSYEIASARVALNQNENNENEIPSLVQMNDSSHTMDTQSHSQTSIIVGEVLLASFAKSLQKSIPVKLDSGVLSGSEGNVYFRKYEGNGKGELFLEGVLSDEYFTTRKQLYTDYAVFE